MLYSISYIIVRCICSSSSKIFVSQSKRSTFSFICSIVSAASCPMPPVLIDSHKPNESSLPVNLKHKRDSSVSEPIDCRLIPTVLLIRSMSLSFVAYPIRMENQYQMMMIIHRRSLQHLQRYIRKLVLLFHICIFTSLLKDLS